MNQKKGGGVRWRLVGNKKREKKYYFNKESVYNRQIDVGVL